jgi:hypothetical protein
MTASCLGCKPWTRVDMVWALGPIGTRMPVYGPFDWLDGHHAPTHFAELVATVGMLDREELGRVFGESLPKGLQIAR